MGNVSAAESLIDALVSEGCKAFLRHWMKLPRTGHAPHSNDFLDHPPAALMPYVLIEDVTAEGLVVRFMGTAVVERWQHDLTGKVIGANLPAAERRRMEYYGGAVATHPCGMRQTGDLRSSTGRMVSFEAVLLPLSVDAGRPPRLVAYSHMLDPLGQREHNSQYAQSSSRSWFDIGAGVPAEPPGND
jgi:hypothetical protein